MRIGVNTLFLLPGEVGGSEIYLVQTLLAMAKFHDETELVLFTNRENDSFLRRRLERFPQVSFQLLNFHAQNRPRRILREQLQLPWAVRRSGVDLLWSPGCTAPLLCSVPQAISILDMQYKSFPEDFSPVAGLAMDILIRLAARRCDRVLTISHFAKSEILHHTSARPEHVHVALLAADPADSAFAPISGTRCDIPHMLSQSTPYLLCVANTYPHKNVAMLVQSYGRIQNRIPHDLVLVGKPRRGEPAVAAAMQTLPDPDRVHRLQGIDQVTLTGMYRGADLFVFPSLYEGFGLPVLEAMAAGVPVLTTRKGSLPEIGDDCVIYFNPEKSGDLEKLILSTLALTSDQRRSLTANASARARTFSWRRTARETMSALQAALNARPKNRDKPKRS